MVINESECVRKMAILEENIKRNAKTIDLNIDLSVIPTIKEEWQYKAYARLKSSQERQKILSLILKLFSEASILTGFLGVGAQIFLGL